MKNAITKTVVATAPERHKARVRECIERAWNAGEFAHLDEHLAADYVLHQTLLPGNIRGTRGLEAYIAAFRTAFPDLKVTLQDVLSEGDTVAIRYTYRGTHEGIFAGIEPTGRRVEGDGMAFVRFEGGKVAEDWFVTDGFGLLRQLGAANPPVA